MLTLASSSLLLSHRRRPVAYRAALLILALSFVVFLLTRGAEASVSRPRPTPEAIATTTIAVPPVVSHAIELPGHESRLRCSGNSARPKLKTVHPCADVFDAELHVTATAGSIQPE